MQKNDPDGSNKKVIGTLQPMPGSSSSRDGCPSFHLYQDAEDLDEVDLFEEWRDEASLAELIRDFGVIAGDP